MKFYKFLFRWYYSQVPEHFRQWTFMQSVKLLIQNYEHVLLLLKNNEAHTRALTKDNDKLRAELSNIKISQVATDQQIRDINKSFGTKWTPPTDN